MVEILFCARLQQEENLKVKNDKYMQKRQKPSKTQRGGALVIASQNVESLQAAVTTNTFGSQKC